MPVIFLQGFVGSLFKEFGVVVAGAVLVSAFVSLTITPVLNVYLNKNGGEPIAGFKLKEGKIQLNQLSDSPFVYVVTSDFLANGGDKMSFLMNPIEKMDYQMLIRDLLILQIRKNKTIFQMEEERIKF